MKNSHPKFSFFPQKADVLKKGKSKSDEDINKISTKFMCLKIFLKTKAKIKKIANYIMVIDN